MNTKIIWFKKASSFLRKLEIIEFKRIVKKINEIIRNPEHYLESLKDINVKKIRIGNYRLFVDYLKEENKLKIYSIRHRKNAYKNK